MIPHTYACAVMLFFFCLSLCLRASLRQRQRMVFFFFAAVVFSFAVWPCSALPCLNLEAWTLRSVGFALAGRSGLCD